MGHQIVTEIVHHGAIEVSFRWFKSYHMSNVCSETSLGREGFREAALDEYHPRTPKDVSVLFPVLNKSESHYLMTSFSTNEIQLAVLWTTHGPRRTRDC